MRNPLTINDLRMKKRVDLGGGMGYLIGMKITKEQYDIITESDLDFLPDELAAFLARLVEDFEQGGEEDSHYEYEAPY